MIKNGTLSRSSDERGAYAVLYALLVVVLIGAGAFVVDISLMRESRAANRSAVDSAVTAAAARLNHVDATSSNPRAACTTAWDYLLAGIDGLPDGTSSCASLPTDATACVTTPSPTAIVVDPVLSDGWSVRITWPVPDTSTLLSQPDVYGSQPTQTLDIPFDGESTAACARIGVEVYQPNRIVLGAALGFAGTVNTRAASVARSTVVGETTKVIAALNVLEERECGALWTDGQGQILIEGVGGDAGVVAVESDGTGSCSGNETHTIQTSNNNINFIRADGPNGPGTGIIQAYALNSPPTGNPSRAFTPVGTPPSIAPTPTRLEARYGAKPVLDIYDCTSRCANGGGAWTTELRQRLGTASPTPQPYTGADSFTSSSFQTLPNASIPMTVGTFDSCSVGTTVVVPPGNWYINCPSDTASQNGLSVNGTLVFQGGTIVTRGKVDVGSSSGCLAVNVPAVACPTANTAAEPDTTNPPPTGDAILYVRNGRLYKVSQAQLFMPQTFVYLENGPYELGGGSGTLLWTTPAAADCAAPDEELCKARRFNRMVVWSESPVTHSLGGQTSFSLRGVLFTPNADTQYTGQGLQLVADAQFWTKRLIVKGQGRLSMRSDPAASVPRPLLGVSLIR